MRIEDVKVSRKPLVRAKPADVDRLESEYWVIFPDGYREYVTRLGEGVLGGHWVRIYPPWRISRELDEWRDRIRRHWFWDKGRKLLPKPRALESIILGDTVGGDELVFHPGRRDRLFVLPRDSETVIDAGRDLLTAVDWMCSSGKLTEAISERNFEPFDTRKQPRGRTAAGKKLTDPQGESFEDIIGAAARWARRHKLLQTARPHVPTPLAKLPPKQLRVTPGRQSVVFGPGEYEEPCFAVAFVLTDSKTGLEIGNAEVQQTPDDTNVTFIPNADNWQKLKKRYGGDAFDVL